MAQFDTHEGSFGTMGDRSQADMLCELGLMYATGRDCVTDLVAAHKWFNIAAIRGSAEAARLRAELAPSLTKPELVRALREAREWMTMH
ncbi:MULTISPECIES: sel1 repeat family protein [Mesorhizobium]|uniref:Sel1 repeat family protein n=1 Tax=Mesorhizobium denitrificans TaxID=2294114 RepID=A0A371XHN3_9HYPH|nr:MULTISPECIES: sel1 repeat family protein [Mesorhizobium]RFC68726.1 sel1 repeat family protein [Mesorhizobium denitrificans]